MGLDPESLDLGGLSGVSFRSLFRSLPFIYISEVFFCTTPQPSFFPWQHPPLDPSVPALPSLEDSFHVFKFKFSGL